MLLNSLLAELHMQLNGLLAELYMLLNSLLAELHILLNGPSAELHMLVAFLLLSYRCIVTINVLWLFITVPWVGLQCFIVVFPDHTHLLFLHMLLNDLLAELHMLLNGH